MLCHSSFFSHYCFGFEFMPFYFLFCQTTITSQLYTCPLTPHLSIWLRYYFWLGIGKRMTANHMPACLFWKQWKRHMETLRWSQFRVGYNRVGYCLWGGWGDVARRKQTAGSLTTTPSLQYIPKHLSVISLFFLPWMVIEHQVRAMFLCVTVVICVFSAIFYFVFLYLYYFSLSSFLSVPLHLCSPVTSLCLCFDLSHVHTQVYVMPTLRVINMFLGFRILPSYLVCSVFSHLVTNLHTNYD